VVEYVNVEQTRDMMAAALSSNLAAMEALNLSSNCSCPDDNDDFRSECENCKNAVETEEVPAAPRPPQETMTLHRHPPSLAHNTAHGYTTSLTLPTRRSRSALLFTHVCSTSFNLFDWQS
jgi:hypothetical protein